MGEFSGEIEADRLTTDLNDLATFSDDGPGCSRTLFGGPYRDSRRWVRTKMQDAGLSVEEEAGGNIVGTLPGADPSAPAIMLGSHTDTVQCGGNFDGVVGVLGAIELIRALRAHGHRLSRTIHVVDFLGEEANRFGLTCLGSRSMMGDLTAADMHRADHDGSTLADACLEIDLDPQVMLNRRRWVDDVGTYLELHIEQGPVLEERGVDIGVVTGIAGIERMVAHFVGQADHAGTMPMLDRRDALAAAAEAVLAIRQLGCGANGAGVATASTISTWPGSPNVVPGAARLEAEMRSTQSPWLDSVRSRLTEEIATKAGSLGVEVDFDWLHDNAAVHLDDSLQSRIATAADATGCSWAPIPSGATHDAAHVAATIPAAMLFIPSLGGRSHCPEEHTQTADIVRGVRVFAQTVVSLDEPQ